mgnify:CR=1 FL=1
MSTKNPRINVVLDNASYARVRFLAERENVSLSTKVRDLIREALEIQEDLDLGAFAEEREATWDDRAALSHEEIWA